MPDLITQPRVTWLIPVKNGMPYLPQTLQSIQQQTCSNHQVLVWDNGSTDGTLEELHRWIPGSIAGRIIADRPLPLGASLAELVCEADTEFCARVDADDVCLPERLQKQMQFLLANPDVAVVGCQINRLDAAGNNLGPCSDYPLVHDRIVETMLLQNPLAHPAVAFRRSAVLDVGNYQDLSPTEDYDLWLRMASRGFHLANLPEYLVNYRVHDKSVTQQAINASRLEEAITGRLAIAAPDLFGCDSATFLQLRHRTHPHAIVPLRQIAGHLKHDSNPWRSPVFYRAARSMIAERDVRSRIGAAYENRGLAGALSELNAITMHAVRYLTRRAGPKR